MRILILTAALIAAFSISALAAPGNVPYNEGNGEQESINLKVEVPVIFFLNWGDNNATNGGLLTFTPSEQEILDGNYSEALTSANNLDWASNRDDTTLTVTETAWSGPSGFDDTPRLQMEDNMGTGSSYLTLIDGANTILGSYDVIDVSEGGNGLAYESVPVNFYADQVDTGVNPGNYTSTVTFTLNWAP